MKLFIWGQTEYTLDYGADTLVVMANHVEEARRLALSAVDFGFGSRSLERRKIDVTNVEPTEIIEGPEAVYCWWSE